jgi:3,4-dihydroxy-2-butanone 4-phosphate synthase
MMGDDGGSRKKEEVLQYAKEHGLSFITGDEVIAAWNEYKAKGN